MKPKFPSFFNASMPRRFCLVGLLALCFTLRPISASAQLTQQQVEDAFYNALIAFCVNGSGIPGFLGTMPFDPDTFESLNALLSYSGDTPVGTSAYLTLANLVGVDPRFWNFLSSLSASNQVNLVQILNAVRALGSVSNDLSGISSQLSDMVENNVEKLDYLSGQLADLVLGMQSATTDLGAINTSTYNASIAVGDILGILRNQENPIEVDIRQTGIAYGILAEILHALDGSGSGGGASIVGVLQGLTNAIAGGEVTPVDVQNFDELAPVLTDFGDELNEKDWRVQVINFDESESDANTVLLRRFQSDFEPYLRSLSSLTNAAALYKRDIESSNEDGPQLYENLTNEVAYSNAQDDTAAGQSITNEILSKMDNEPDMPAYETGDEPTSRFDAQFKSDLIPSGSLNPSGLQHDTRITLISAADFRAGTGVSGEMVYDIFGGNGGSVGSFFSKLDSIIQLGWQGYFAVLSALMFWRYQSKIAKALNTGK